MRVKIKYEGEAKACNIENVKQMSLQEFKKACKEARQVPGDADLKPNFRVRMWADEKNVNLSSEDVLKAAIDGCPEGKPLKIIIKKKDEGDDDADSE